MEPKAKTVLQPLLPLLPWEFRQIWGKKRLTWGVVQLVCLFVLTALLFAFFRATLSSNIATLSYHSLLAAFLTTTPLKSSVAEQSQINQGYLLLRSASYATLFLCKLILPALAAGIILKDHNAQRTEDFRMLPIKPSIRYLAKALTAGFPYVAFHLFLMFALLPVLFAEYVPLAEVLRLLWETLSQIALTACLSLTCSTLFRGFFGARLAAYILLWGVLPTVWMALLLLTSSVPSLYEAVFRLDIDNGVTKFHWEPLSFWHLCWLQALLTLLCLALCLLLGLRRMQRDSRSSDS